MGMSDTEIAMIAVAARSIPDLIPFPTLTRQVIDEDLPFDPAEHIGLRRYYEGALLPDISGEQAPRSLDSDRCALNRWEECVGNPDIRDVTATHAAGVACLQIFRDRLEARGLSPATINSYWREIKAIFVDACDRGLTPRVPRLGKRRKARLVKEPPKLQRETITEDELTELWRKCSHATYPRGGQFPAPMLWRVALVLFWTYGARTLDMLKALRWENIRFSDRMIRFEAMKTSKLQGLPMTEIVLSHLKSIRGHSERVFPGFDTPGCKLRKRGWKRGYYTTWRHEIGAEEMQPKIWLKHFRESMVTRYNDLWPDLGAWVAAHYMPGVTAQSYDLPTARVREIISSAAVPACFQEIG